MSKKSSATVERENNQLALCRQLITHHSFRTQQEIRESIQQRGYPEISQSTISRLLSLLDVIKITNARGEKIYALNPDIQAKPDAISPLSSMVISVDYNEKFVIVQVAAGYARAVARVIEHRNFPEVLGIVATNTAVWIAPRDTLKTRQTQRLIAALMTPDRKDIARNRATTSTGIAS